MNTMKTTMRIFGLSLGDWAAAVLPAFALCACGTGNGGQDGVKTPEGGSANPAESAVVSPADSPSAKAAESAAAPTDPKAGERRMAGGPNAGKSESAGTGAPFAGDDPGKAVAIPTKRAFSLGPAESWTIGLYEFVKTEGTKNYFKEPGETTIFAIPGAYTKPAEPVKGLKKGAAVLIPDEGGMACARVISASDTEVKISMMTGDTEKGDKSVKPDEVLVLEAKLDFGARVAYQSDPKDSKWQLGGLVYKDDKTAWLEGATRVPATQVKAMDVVKIYKAGDKVWAVPTGTAGFVPATVAKVMFEGLLYQVKLSDGSTKNADFCSVTSPL